MEETEIKCRLKPLRNMVLLEAIPEEEKMKNGILIPDSVQDKPVEGKVVAVGDGDTSFNGTAIPMVVAAGDKVLYSKYAGVRVEMDSKEYLMMKEAEIIAVFTA